MKSFALSLLTVLVLFYGCTQAQNAQNIDAKTFKEMLGKTPNKILLDVRTDGEVAAGVIEGAKQMDFNGPHFEHQLDGLDKSKPVFVYCAVGGRSGSAMRMMKQKGFKEVYNLDGGINAWRAAGYPTTAIKK
ncbi:MAG: rhodanese-like domain-containing protein [Runella sp.]